MFNDEKWAATPCSAVLARCCAAAVVVAVSAAGCGASSGVEPVSEPVGQAEPTEEDSGEEQQSEDVESINEIVRRAGAEADDVDLSEIAVDDAMPLGSTGCWLGWYWPEALPGFFVNGVTVLSDGTTVVGGRDEKLAEAAQRCFLDAGIVPDVDVAADFVFWMGSMPPGSEVDGGFTVSFFTECPEDLTLAQVTTTIDGTGASTSSESFLFETLRDSP